MDQQDLDKFIDYPYEIYERCFIGDPSILRLVKTINNQTELEQFVSIYGSSTNTFSLLSSTSVQMDSFFGADMVNAKNCLFFVPHTIVDTENKINQVITDTSALVDTFSAVEAYFQQIT